MTDNPFTPDEVELIRQRYETDGPKKLAEIMDMDKKRVCAKAWKMGLMFDSRRSNNKLIFTEEQDCIIKREWPLIVRRVGGRTAEKLAKQLKVSRSQLYNRAGILGLRRIMQITADWSDKELELLDRWGHLHPKTISTKLRRAGYRRTEAAIMVKRNRICQLVSENTNCYSAHGLARLLGVSTTPVLRWIRLGYLKATARGDSKHATGGPGDRWMIYPKDVRKFLCLHTAIVDFSCIDKYWLIELLAGDQCIPTLHQNHSGIKHDASGLQEHSVCY